MLLAASLAPLGSTMIAVALPSIGHDIGAEASDLTSGSCRATSLRASRSRARAASWAILSATAARSSWACRSWRRRRARAAGRHVHALGVARILMASGGAATVPATMAILRNQTADRRAAGVRPLRCVHGSGGGDRSAARRRADRAVRMARGVRGNLPVIAVSLRWC